MKKKIIFSTMFAFAIFTGQAQENKTTDSKVEIKIVTVDENGNKEVVVKQYNDLNLDAIEGLNEMYLSDANIEIVECKDGKQVFVTHQMHTPDGPFLGIHLAKANGGILITEVVKNSGAEIAGLQKGDVLTSFNKVAITSHEDLKSAMENIEVGDKVKIEYLRDEVLNITSATLGEFPEQDYERKMIWVKDGNEMIFSDEDNMDFTYDLEELKTKPFLGITPVEKAVDITGVMIFEVIEGTSAEKLGLQTGDIIYEINSQIIENFDDLVSVLKTMSPEDAIEVKYKRDGVRKTTSGNLGSKADSKNSMKFIVKDYHYDSDDIIQVDVMVFSISDEEIEMLSKSSGKDLKNVDELDDVDIEIYPNPSTGNFSVKFNSPEKDDVTIKVYNANGTEVFSKTVNDFNGEYKTEIDLDDKSSGAYFMVISQKDRVLTEKIIIQ